jgi:hypothetical protein
MPPPAFEEIVLPHLEAAFNYARWLTRNDAEAEDVVQDACVRAMRYFSSLRHDKARDELVDAQQLARVHRASGAGFERAWGLGLVGVDQRQDPIGLGLRDETLDRNGSSDSVNGMTALIRLRSR